jgi:FkbM family methyltransferase
MPVIAKILSILLRFIPEGVKHDTKKLAFRFGVDPFARLFFGQFAEDACVYSYFGSKTYYKYRDLAKMDPGFFVEIGAFDPINISNTYVFYKNGWSGITVEAAPGVKERFDKCRPRDINLQCAVSDREGTLPFYVFGCQSVYNTVDATTAERVAQELGVTPDVIFVPSKRLETILDEHLPPDQSIQFLSVDVEGIDFHVLKSNNWDKYRPELVAVELHSDSLDVVEASETTRFMESLGYRIRFWTPPTVIYRDSLIDSKNSVEPGAMTVNSTLQNAAAHRNTRTVNESSSNNHPDHLQQ